MLAKFSKRGGIFVFILSMLLSSHSLAITPAARNIALLSNFMSIAGGALFFGAATLDVIDQTNNSTQYDEAHKHLGASALLSFGIGAALEIVSVELGKPQLVNRMDEIAIGMTSLGFMLVSSGIWTSNTNAMLVGSVTVSSFFASRALLLPLLINSSPNSYRPSDKVLLGALTIFGNVGGLLLTWSNFETSPYRRQILQAGSYVLGIINPVVFTGLTISLLSKPHEGAPIA